MILKGLLNARFALADYKPMIKFPNRQDGGSTASEMKFSGKKIKMTNREALNSAMKEEMERD